MNWKAAVITSTLSILLVFCLILALPNTRAVEQKPRVYVVPKEVVFYVSHASVGATFNVNISADDWTALGAFAYEIKLYYNNSLLQAITADFPVDSWIFYTRPIIFLILPGPSWIEIHQQEGFVVAGSTLLADEPGRTGGGTMISITFRIIQAPAPGQRLSCLLELGDVIMVDPDAELIPPGEYDVLNGNYVFSGKEDLNLDGMVNILDIAILAQAYGSHPEDARWNPKADLNGDGEVNIIDFSAVARDWTW